MKLRPWLEFHLRGGVLALAALATGWLSLEAIADDPPTAAPTLCQGHHQTEEEARAQLARFAKSYSNLEEWLGRARKIREGIRAGAGLDPWPARTPMLPIIRDRREYDGYSVESIAFESVPGFLVTGSLYRPLDRELPHAGILSPHGHGHEPNGGGRYRPANQIRCAAFARMGAVVLSCDMIGFGDSRRPGRTAPITPRRSHRADHTAPFDPSPPHRQQPASARGRQLPPTPSSSLSWSGAAGLGLLRSRRLSTC